VRCKGAQAGNCLTDHQIGIARRIYDGPRRADGTQIVQSSVLPGSELALIRTGAKYASLDGKPYWFMGKYASDMLRDLAFDPAPGPGWMPDPAMIDDYVKRMGLMDTLFSATNPDMRAYKARGGKLLIYMGWNDVLGGVRAPIDYYENVERMMGGEKNTGSFFRLFMMPGMDHCKDGEGASVFDWLGELDKWVETGKAPASVTGYHPKRDGTPEFYRTVKPYRSGSVQ
jgi:feruloyl esterase